jgi:SAM-dependent methyltransferase
VVLDPHRDGQFLYHRIEEAMLEEGTRAGGRTLDVACGVGKLATEVTARGGEGWGLEPSKEMLGLGRWVYPDGRAALVRGVAETLPFRDGSFDRIICQGSLDHFVAPQDFMQEAARVMRPDGRLIIALANYESLSCRLGRSLLRWRRAAGRPYWQIPPDHNHKGDLAFVQQLGSGRLRLERCYGISLLWQFPRWGRCLNVLPGRPAGIVLSALDRLAYRAPALADMIVSVWRPAVGENTLR